MLVVEHIAQLVAHALRLSDGRIHIVVRMPIYPVVNAAIGNVVAQFHHERPIRLAALELGALQQVGWGVVGGHYLVPGLAPVHRLLDER